MHRRTIAAASLKTSYDVAASRNVTLRLISSSASWMTEGITVVFVLVHVEWRPRDHVIDSYVR